ncbi:MAG: hypothetical protein NTW10_02435 [Bacteroidetes bacterium]|nr:hypothetical protein [Bacteroidota bacterium]
MDFTFYLRSEEFQEIYKELDSIYGEVLDIGSPDQRISQIYQQNTEEQYYLKLFGGDYSLAETLLEGNFSIFPFGKVEFLEFVLKSIPEGDVSNDSFFAMITDRSGFNARKQSIISWVDLKRVEMKMEKIKPQIEMRYDKLFEAFKDPDKYQRILNLLVTKKFCNPGNHSWIGQKAELGDLYNRLNVQGYLHRKLSPKEKVSISINSFGINISESILRQTKVESSFLFIPLATTIS